MSKKGKGKQIEISKLTGNTQTLTFIAEKKRGSLDYRLLDRYTVYP